MVSFLAVCIQTPYQKKTRAHTHTQKKTALDRSPWAGLRARDVAGRRLGPKVSTLNSESRP